MKKIKFLFICILSLSAAVFAQSAKYSDLIKKAKAAEAAKEWTYAMGYYLDAIAEDAEDKSNAYDSLMLIYDSIKSGNPGYRADGSSWSSFELYEDWSSLLINTEKYWTEYCPYNFVLKKPEMGTPDLAAKTAEYRALIVPENSYKFNFIINGIFKGYSKVLSHNADWSELPGIGRSWAGTENFLDSGSGEREVTSGKPESLGPVKYEYGWPVVSAAKIPGAKKQEFKSHDFKWKDYPLVKDNSLFNKNGAAVYSIPRELNWSGNTYEFGNIEYFNPWFIYTNNENTIVPRIMYELKVKLVDEKGNVLAKAGRFMPAAELKTIDFNDKFSKYKNYAYIKFPGITQAQMKLIDSGKAWLEIEAVYLKYGFQNYSDIKNYDSNDRNADPDNALDFKKNLPELEIPLEKCIITNELAGKIDSLKKIFKELAVKNIIKNKYYGKETRTIEGNKEVIKIPASDEDFENVSLPYGVKIDRDIILKTLSDLYGIKEIFKPKLNGDGCVTGYVAERIFSSDEKNKIFNENKIQAEAYLAANEEAVLYSFNLLKYDSSSEEYEEAKTAADAISGMHKGIENKNTAYLMNALSAVKNVNVEKIKNAAAVIEVQYNDVQKTYDSYKLRYEYALKYLGEYDRDVSKESDLVENVKFYLDEKDLASAKKSCEKLKAQESVFAAADVKTKKAEEAVLNAGTLSEEKTAFLKEAAALFEDGFYSGKDRQQYYNLESALEDLNSSIKKNDASEIYESYEKTMAVDVSSLSSSVEKKKAENSEKNKKAAEEIKADVQNKKAVLDSVKAYAAGTKAEAEFAAIYGSVEALEKSFSAASDAEIISKKSEIEKLNYEATVFAVEEAAAISILKDYGITLTEYSGSIEVFEEGNFESGIDAKIYSIAVAKKSAAEKAKLKKSDLLFFALSDSAKEIKIKNSKSSHVTDWKEFVNNVVKSKEAGKLDVIYFRKSMGSYDGYAVELSGL